MKKLMMVMLGFAFIVSSCNTDSSEETNDGDSKMEQTDTKSDAKSTNAGEDADGKMDADVELNADGEVMMKASPINMSSPLGLVAAVVNAAETGDLSLLSGLCDPEDKNDKDTDKICAIASMSKEDQVEFRNMYRNAKLIGEPEMKGDDKAKVTIKLMPDDSKNQDFKLVKRDGVWYLKSY